MGNREFIRKELIKMTPAERRSLLKICDKVIDAEDAKLLTKQAMNIGEATLLEALTTYGYSRKELKQKLIKLGDIGTLGEWVKKHPKQKRMTDFFGGI